MAWTRTPARAEQAWQKGCSVDRHGMDNRGWRRCLDGQGRRTAQSVRLHWGALHHYGGGFGRPQIRAEYFQSISICNRSAAERVHLQRRLGSVLYRSGFRPAEQRNSG